MAKVKLPSYLTGLNGRMGDAVIYKSGNRICMRIYVKPHNPKTEPQQANRRLFAEAMAAWKKLSDEEKYHYRKRTRRLDMLPHNLFVKEYMQAHTGANIQIKHSVSSGNSKSLYAPPSLQLQYHSEATPYIIKIRPCLPHVEPLDSSG